MRVFIGKTKEQIDAEREAALKFSEVTGDERPSNDLWNSRGFMAEACYEGKRLFQYHVNDYPYNHFPSEAAFYAHALEITGLRIFDANAGYEIIDGEAADLLVSDSADTIIDAVDASSTFGFTVFWTNESVVRHFARSSNSGYTHSPSLRPRPSTITVQSPASKATTTTALYGIIEESAKCLCEHTDTWIRWLGKEVFQYRPAGWRYLNHNAADYAPQIYGLSDEELLQLRNKLAERLGEWLANNNVINYESVLATLLDNFGLNAMPPATSGLCDRSGPSSVTETLRAHLSAFNSMTEEKIKNYQLHHYLTNSFVIVIGARNNCDLFGGGGYYNHMFQLVDTTKTNRWVWNESVSLDENPLKALLKPAPLCFEQEPTKIVDLKIRGIGWVYCEYYEDGVINRLPRPHLNRY